MEDGIGVRLGAPAETPLQVFVYRHEGGEPQAGGDHPVDEGTTVGRVEAVDQGGVVVDTVLVGQAVEAQDGEWDGPSSCGVR